MLSRQSYAEIGLADSIIRTQSLVVSLKYDPSGFKHVAMVGRFKRLGDPLLDKKQGQAGLAADFDEPFKNEICYRRRQAHRWFVKHQKFR